MSCSPLPMFPPWPTPGWRSNAGVDGLVHLFADEPVDAEFVELAREADIFIIPTATVLASVLGHSGADWLTSDSGFGDQLTAMQRQTLLQRFPGSDARRNAWPGVLASIEALHAAGVPILAGSDAPNPRNRVWSQSAS